MNRDLPTVNFEGELKIGEGAFYNLKFTKIEIIDNLMSPLIVNNTLSEENNIKNLNNWFSKRLFSVKRKIPHTDRISFEDEYPHFFSMSDNYWIKYNENEKWEELSFFTSENVSNNMGNYLFSNNRYIRTLNVPHDAPEITTNGVQDKRWIFKLTTPMGNLFALRKRASKKLGTEVWADVISSNILKNIGFAIDYIPYSLVIDNGMIASECLNFITKDTEFVSATQILTVTPKVEGEDLYQTLIRAGKIYNIPDVEIYLNNMMYADELLFNEDRNTGNIGFIRDSNGAFIKCAPLFDFGFSFLNVSDPAQKNIFTKKRRELHKEEVIKKPNYDIVKEEINAVKGYDIGIERINKMIDARMTEKATELKF